MDINQELLVTTDSFELPFYDCDYVKRAKISTILKITAQIAGKDYTDRGLGHRFLWDEGYVFLLSRISIHIHRYPVEPEKLVTSTWESGRSGAMFMRGYDVKVGDEVCVDGESGWIVVNPISRKIIRPAAFPWQMPQVTDRVVSALPIGKIFGENAKKIGEHLVKIPELDANGHVYNANYGDIAVEFLSTQMYEQDVENFRINFVNEAKLGDLIDIYLAEDEGKAIVFGKCGEKICFETEFIWKK